MQRRVLIVTAVKTFSKHRLHNYATTIVKLQITNVTGFQSVRNHCSCNMVTGFFQWKLVAFIIGSSVPQCHKLKIFQQYADILMKICIPNYS